MSSKLGKSAIVAGAGLAASLWTLLVKKVRQAGGTDAHIHRLVTPSGEKTLDEIARVIVGKGRQRFRIVVDYTKTLEEMISAGEYDYVNGGITAGNFQVDMREGSRVEKDLVLFHFNRLIGSEQVIAEMNGAGFRPATVPELLSLGAEYKGLQLMFPIVAFGSARPSSTGEDELVVVLDSGYSGRSLNIAWIWYEWDETCRFAAVRD